MLYSEFENTKLAVQMKRLLLASKLSFELTRRNGAVKIPKDRYDYWAAHNPDVGAEEDGYIDCVIFHCFESFCFRTTRPYATKSRV